MRAWGTLLLAAVLAPGRAPAATSSDYNGPRSDTFALTLYAPFLEPGDGAEPRPGEELRVEEFHVQSGSGTFAYSLWGVEGKAVFTTSPDGKALRSLATELDGDSETPALRVWRHRHGYTRDKAGRYWWNTLGEASEPLDPRLGAVYDRFLREVWRLWTARRISALLNGKAPPAVPPGPERSTQELVLSYDATGLVGTFPVDMQIRLWGIPVRLHFTLAPAQPTPEDTWIVGLTDLVTLGYSREDWRRRHGYRIGFWGARRWDADFPGHPPDLQVYGALLDRLLDRAARFWSDSSVNIALAGLDQELKTSVYQLRAPPPAQ